MISETVGPTQEVLIVLMCRGNADGQMAGHIALDGEADILEDSVLRPQVDELARLVSPETRKRRRWNPNCPIGGLGWRFSFSLIHFNLISGRRSGGVCRGPRVPVLHREKCRNQFQHRSGEFHRKYPVDSLIGCAPTSRDVSSFKPGLGKRKARNRLLSCVTLSSSSRLAIQLLAFRTWD